MSITMLTRPVRRFLIDRLERLREALENLVHRLRESVAQLLGTHVGDSVREAVEKALQVKSQRRFEPEPFSHHRDREQHFEDDDFEQDRFWRPEASIWEPPERETAIQEKKPSRWNLVLAAAVQVLCWSVRWRADRPSLLQLVGIGTAIGVTTLLGLPLLGGALLTIGAAFLLTKLAVGARPANATTF